MQELTASPVMSGQSIDLFNEEISREVHSVTSYASSSRRVRDVAVPRLSYDLKAHSEHQPSHAMAIATQIDSPGGATLINRSTSSTIGDPARAEVVLQSEQDNEAESKSQYQTRVSQLELLGELEVAQFIRRILAQDMDHFSRLKTVLGSFDAAQSMHVGALASSVE